MSNVNASFLASVGAMSPRSQLNSMVAESMDGRAMRMMDRMQRQDFDAGALDFTGKYEAQLAKAVYNHLNGTPNNIVQKQDMIGGAPALAVGMQSPMTTVNEGVATNIDSRAQRIVNMIRSNHFETDSLNPNKKDESLLAQSLANRLESSSISMTSTINPTWSERVSSGDLSSHRSMTR